MLRDNMRPGAMARKTIAVWFSCGAASAVAAYETIRQYGSDYEIRVVNNPVLEEDSDNVRFMLDVQEWLGVEIEFAMNPKYPSASAVDVWEERKFMAAPHGAPCTVSLKKEARYLWERNNPVDFHVLGFTSDEKVRHDRFVLTERENVIPVLIDAGITKADCAIILDAAGIRIPRVYEMGYPNANCIGCVKATSPTYWNHVRRQHPGIFAERAAQSRALGARLVRVKGKRVFLDELDPAARGAPLKSSIVECSSFCEEKP